MGFKKWLAEVTHDELSRVGDEINSSLIQKRPAGQPTQMLYDDIFGSDLRVVVPIQDSKKRTFQYHLLDQGYEPDFHTGMASKTIQTQMGPKVRKERIGAVLTKLIKEFPNEESWKEWLSWWEKNKVNLARPQIGGVSVIISRSPIDILRMSDHSEWTSCHATPRKYGQGGYWKSAIQEAKTGGAIAYVVRNSDLAKVPNLQAKEIFADADRHLKGIEPLERVRLRRFSNKDTNLLLPELKTYGTKHTEFLDTVLDWSRHAQRHLIDHENPHDFEEFDLHGGSYQDSDADDIWNQFFDSDEDNQASGGKDSVDEDGEVEKDEDNTRQLVNDANEAIAQHNWDHYYVDVDDYDDENFRYNGGVSFDFNVEDFIKVPQWGDARAIFKAFKDDWSDYPGHIEDHDIDSDKEMVYFRFRFYDPDAGNEIEHLDDFLNEVDSADSHYDTAHKTFWEILIKLGWMHDWREELSKLPLQHLKFEWYEGNSNASAVAASFVSGYEWVGDLKGISTDKVVIYRHTAIKGDGAGFFLYRVEVEPPTILNYAKSIFPEKFQNSIKFFVSNPPQRTPEMKYFEYPLKLYLHVDLDVPEQDKDLAQIVQHVDQYWNNYLKSVAEHWEQCKPVLMPIHDRLSLNKQGINVDSNKIERPYMSTPPRPQPSTERQTELPFKDTLPNGDNNANTPATHPGVAGV